MEKRCGKCRRKKDIEEFAISRSKPDGRQSWCKPCKKKVDKAYYAKHGSRMRGQIKESKKKAQVRNQNYVLEFLRQHPCTDCGETDPIVLDFDHVRGEKLEHVSVMVQSGFSLEALKAEIKKCKIRCANCHRRRTARMNGNWKILRC